MRPNKQFQATVLASLGPRLNCGVGPARAYEQRRRSLKSLGIAHAVALAATLAAIACSETQQEVPQPNKPIKIVSPLDGAITTPGSTIEVAAEVDPDIRLRRAVVDLRLEGWVERVRGPPYRASFKIPEQRGGRLTIGVNATAEDGTRLEHTVTIISVPGETPLQIYAASPDWHAPVRLGDAGQIKVRGRYADGRLIDISSAAAGTTYRSSDPTIAKVDPDGRVMVLNTGPSVIEVNHRGLTTKVRVTTGVPEPSNRFFPRYPPDIPVQSVELKPSAKPSDGPSN